MTLPLDAVNLHHLLDLLQNKLPIGLRFPQKDLNFTLPAHAAAECAAAPVKAAAAQGAGGAGGASYVAAGSRVRLIGLRGAAHLNGREGVVHGADPANSERVIVRLADASDVSVKRENCSYGGGGSGSGGGGGGGGASVGW